MRAEAITIWRYKHLEKEEQTRGKGGDKKGGFCVKEAELEEEVTTRKDIFGMVKGGESRNCRKGRCFLELT
jgi:hypothetical protein